MDTTFKRLTNGAFVSLRIKKINWRTQALKGEIISPKMMLSNTLKDKLHYYHHMSLNDGFFLRHSLLGDFVIV
jgi:hypothetical protein